MIGSLSIGTLFFKSKIYADQKLLYAYTAINKYRYKNSEM